MSDNNVLLGGTLGKDEMFRRIEIPRLEGQCQGLVRSLKNGLDKIRNYKMDGITVQSGGRAEHYDYDVACKIAPEHMAELDGLECVLEEALLKLGVIEQAVPVVAKKAVTPAKDAVKAPVKKESKVAKAAVAYEAKQGKK